MEFWVQLATIVVGFSTPGLLVFAVFQMRQNARLSRVDEARVAWREYLKYSMDNVELAFPNYAELKRDPKKLEQYEWFVSWLIKTVDDLISAKIRDGDYDFDEAAKSQLNYHFDFLMTDYRTKSFSSLPGGKLKKLISQVKPYTNSKQAEVPAGVAS